MAVAKVARAAKDAAEAAEVAEAAKGKHDKGKWSQAEDWSYVPPK
jgi:hypothetical protein